MSNEEFEFILAALEFIVTYGQRFLTLYHFDLRTGSWTAKKKALLCLIKNNNSNSVHFLPLANDTKATKVDKEQSRECKNAETKHNNGMVTKFESYLKTAIEIACLLPRCPPQRRLQKELDLNFLHYCV